MNEWLTLKRMSGDDTMSETQNIKAVLVVKAKVAAKLSNILESWDSFSKEDLRRQITVIRDELFGNATDAKSFSPADFKAAICANMKQTSLNKMDEIVHREVSLALEKAKTKIAFCKLSGRDGVELDVYGAVALLEERIKEGDCEAKWMLGLCCEYGIGTEQDIERAETLYQESFEEGNAVGEFLMKSGKGRRGSGVMKVKSL